MACPWALLSALPLPPPQRHERAPVPPSWPASRLEHRGRHSLRRPERARGVCAGRAGHRSAAHAWFGRHTLRAYLCGGLFKLITVCWAGLLKTPAHHRWECEAALGGRRTGHGAGVHASAGGGGGGARLPPEGRRPRGGGAQSGGGIRAAGRRTRTDGARAAATWRRVMCLLPLSLDGLPAVAIASQAATTEPRTSVSVCVCRVFACGANGWVGLCAIGEGGATCGPKRGPTSTAGGVRSGNPRGGGGGGSER
eukprot:COSAG01_NODE_2174_length_8226_cov_8.763961_5_plen_253_part_00